jgi:hypothetical protein
MDARDGAVMGRAYAGSIRTYVHNYTQAPFTLQLNAKRPVPGRRGTTAKQMTPKNIQNPIRPDDPKQSRLR